MYINLNNFNTYAKSKIYASVYILLKFFVLNNVYVTKAHKTKHVLK